MRLKTSTTVQPFIWVGTETIASFDQLYHIIVYSDNFFSSVERDYRNSKKLLGTTLPLNKA